MNLRAALPSMRENSGSFRSMYSCGNLHMPPGQDLSVLGVAHLNIRDRRGVNRAGIVASGARVYGSSNAIYVSRQAYTGMRLDWSRRTSFPFSNNTEIHKFSLRGRRGKPVYAASGTVPGTILNSFSMSEHDGFLRVATTDRPGWNRRMATPPPANNLYVLGQHGKRLRTVGKLTGLAKGERIYAARMMGDTGYVVTFRRTDPLFTLDLSNPRHPRVVGELKINGYSSYIHPLPNDRLLTIGQDATDTGRTLGTHLQVFDVSDPAHPTRLFHHKIASEGRTFSAAESDHHAFTYDPLTRTLAIPVTDNRSTASTAHALAIYQLDDRRGFRELGRISHGNLLRKARTAYCAEESRQSHRGCRAPSDTPNRWMAWRARIDRSFIADDVVFTLSGLGIKANHLHRPRRTFSSRLL